LLLYVPPHLLNKTIIGRSPWPKRFLRSVGRIVGLRVTMVGEPLAAHTLAVSNHVSWLDILVLGGSAGTAFVSKAEVKRTLLIGWLADQNHTLYVERAERGDAHGQVQRIGAALARPQPLTVFPEGTTGPGTHLLPFRPTLLHAVAPPPEGAVVRPVALDYAAAAEIAWHWGEAGMANVMRVLGRPGRVDVTVRLLDALPVEENRKRLAVAAREAIATALTSISPDRSC
jgi:1-acyl-sn-glycerol-3-phosphate acyltransferase